MLFCDAVIIEQGTGKTTLVGTFSGVAAPVFPSPPRDFHIYVQMTSFVGEKPMRLTCIRTDLPEPEEIYSSQHVARFRDKLIVEQVHFVWRQFEYQVQANTSSNFGAKVSVLRSGAWLHASGEIRHEEER